MNSKTDQVTNSLLVAIYPFFDRKKWQVPWQVPSSNYPARMRTSFLINHVDVTSQGAHPRGELEGGGRGRGGAQEEVQRHPQTPRVSQLFYNFRFLSCRFDKSCSSPKIVN